MKTLMSSLLLMSVVSFARTPQMPIMQDCPMKVAGAEVAVTDTADGIAVTFTTKTVNVEELRKRVERMATVHSGSADKPSPMAGKMLDGTAKYEAIPAGARLTLTPKDPAKLADFRKQVQGHVERMTREGNCSMMQEMMQGMMKGMTDKSPQKEKPEAPDHSTHRP
jgi:hypothetical protein